MRKNYLLTVLVMCFACWLPAMAADIPVVPADLFKMAPDPPDGSVVTQVDKFHLHFQDYEFHHYYDDKENRFNAGSIYCYRNGVKLTKPSWGTLATGSVSCNVRDIPTESGFYEVRIPEGYFYTVIDGVKYNTPQISWHAVIEGDIQWSAVPANNTAVSELETIQLEFEGATKIDLSDDAEEGWITATLNGVDMPSTPVVGRNGALSLRGVNLSEGTYVLNLHEGLFTITLADGNVTKSPAITLTYTIDYTAWVPNITATYSPEKDSKVSQIDKLKINFAAEGLQSVALGNATADGYTVKLGDKTYKYGVDFTAGTDPTEMVFNSPVTGNGTALVHIDAGFYTLNFDNGKSLESLAQGWSFSVDDNAWVEALKPTYTPANNADVEKLDKLSVSFAGDDFKSMAVSADATADSFTVTVGSTVYKYGVDFAAGSNPGEVVFGTPVTATGTAKVKVASGFWTITSTTGKTAPSPACEWQVKISGSLVVPDVDPAAGDIFDPTLFNTVTLTMPSEDMVVGSVSTSLYKVQLLKVADDGSVTEVARYNGKKDPDGNKQKAVFTAKAAISELELGHYRFKVANNNALTVTQGGVKVKLGTISYDYYLKEPVKYPAIDPAAGEISNPTLFNTVTITMPAEDMVVGSVSTSLKKVQLLKVNDDGTTEQVIRYNGKKDSANKQLAIFTAKAMPESWTDGNYRFYIQKGAMTATQGGVKVFDEDLNYDFTLVQGSVTPVVEWTLTPAEGATVEELTEFSVAFKGVKEVAFGESMSEESVTLKQGDLTLRYTEGFTEGDDITTMVLDTPLKSAGEVTVTFAEGLYTLTLDDGTQVPSPQVTGKFTVTPAVTGPYSTTPAQGTTVKTLKEFSVKFTDVKEVAFSENISASGITLTQGDKVSLTYTSGILEGNDITTMVLDKVLATSGEVTVTIAAGFYDLTMADGSTQPSPEVKWSFNVEGDPYQVLNISTTPTKGGQASNLSRLILYIYNASSGELGDTQVGATIKYGDTTLNYGTDFTVSADNIYVMELKEPLNITGEVTVTIGAGFYNFIVDGQKITSPEVKWSFNMKAVATGDPVWVPVKSVTQLESLQGKDLVIAWYYGGKFEINLAPEMKDESEVQNTGSKRQAPPIENGKMACVVMNNTQTLGGNGYIGFRGTNEVTPVLSDGNAFMGLLDIPEGTSLVQFTKTTQGYTLWNSNCETPGYLCPMENMNLNRNFLNTSQTPWYNNVSITSGVASIIETTRDDKNLLSAITIWSMNGNNECAFQYVSQELDLGNMYILARKSDMAAITVMADPESGSVMPAPQEAAAGKDLGVVEVKFTFDGAEQAVYDAEAAKVLAATFEGEALAADRIECDNANPALVKFYLPVNKGGKLEVSAPAGWYTLTADGETMPSPAFEYTLSLTEVLKVLDVKIGITPENGSRVTSISEVVVKMPQGISCEINPDMLADDATPVTVTLNGNLTDIPVMVDPTHFRYRPEFNDAGTYVLTLAEGLYILTLEDGTKGLSPEVKTTVEVDPTGVVLDVNYTTVPANRATVEGELKDFSIMFAGVTETAFGPAADSGDGLTVTIGDKTMHYGDGFAESEQNINVMVFDEPQKASDTTVMVDMAEGFYLLTLEDGTVGQSPAVHFSFTLTDASGIVAIFGEDFDGDVYTLGGVCVVRKATAADLKVLAPGLYIIKGRVVMVK